MLKTLNTSLSRFALFAYQFIWIIGFPVVAMWSVSFLLDVDYSYSLVEPSVLFCCCSMRSSLYLNFIPCAPWPRLQFSVIRSSVWMRVIKGIHAEENEHQCVKGWKCDRINTKTTGNLKYLYLHFFFWVLMSDVTRYHFDSVFFC